MIVISRLPVADVASQLRLYGVCIKRPQFDSTVCGMTIHESMTMIALTVSAFISLDVCMFSNRSLP